MSNYKSNYSGSQLDNVIGLFHGKGLDQVTGLVQRNADGSFSQGSGGSGSDIFVATPDVTTFTQLTEAINNNKQIIVNTDNGLATVVNTRTSNDYCHLDAINITAMSTDGIMYAISSTNIWTETSVLGQERLTSGTNIKTINNNSILGSGNINTTDHIFVITPEVTTYNELLAAIQAGKYLCIYSNNANFVNITWIWKAKVDNNNDIYLHYNINSEEKLSYKITSSNTWTLMYDLHILDTASSLSASRLSGEIPSSVTATTQSSGDNSTKIATTAYVDRAINDLPEPMVFEGSLGEGGTISTLPTASSTNKGFTYKVITDGTYASKAAKVGDTFISDGTAWILVPSGDEPSGTVTSIATGAGLIGGPVTSSGTIKANLVSETSQGTIGVTDKLYAVGVDSTGALCALVPWTDTLQNLVDGSAEGSVRGVNTTAEDSSYTIGKNAVAEGAATKASGANSHAEGGRTTASGHYSHAEGGRTTASGHYSHAQNLLTIAAKESQTAIGKYNIEDTETTEANQKALIIGNGTDNNNRSNALTVDWTGKIEIALDTSATSGTDKDIYDALVSLGWDSEVIV